MKTTNLIISNLKAMGADPIATTDKDGNTVIKVNAPTPPKANDLLDFTDPWTAFFEPD